MLQRKSIAGENPKANILPRRSPRFLQPEALDPKTPNPEPRRTRVLHSGSTPLSSTPKASLNSNKKLCKEEVSKKGKGNNVELKSPVEVNSGLRRSARLSGIMSRQEGLLNACEDSKMGDKSGREISYNVEKRVTRSSSRGKYDESAAKGGNRKNNVEKRVTRSSSRGKYDESAAKGGNRKNNDGVNECILGKDLKKKVMPDEGRSMVGGNLSKEFIGQIEKRVACNASRGNKNEDGEQVSNSSSNKCTTCAADEGSDKGAVLGEGKGKKGSRLSRHSSVERGKDRNVDRGKKQIGVKRKRNQDEEEYVVVKGWTKEQELVLQRAYFAAKPTPHFWKKVARMVPGKSAQECFDKVHCDHLTPPQAQPRSRAKKTSPSSLSFSASKLLSSTEPKSKKFKYSRCNSRLAQKTVRQLLQKQCNVDQEEETDLFAVLEATVDLSIGTSQQCKMYSTPEHNKGGLSFLKRCQETPSSAHRKQLSRLSISHGASLISPPVLKQVKNKALHEKYIDQLHCREAKRKAALVRAAKLVKGKSNGEESHKAKLDAVKAAKSALFLDASDAINQFQHLQTSAVDNSDHSDDDGPNREDDEGEDGP